MLFIPWRLDPSHECRWTSSWCWLVLALAATAEVTIAHRFTPMTSEEREDETNTTFAMGDIRLLLGECPSTDQHLLLNPANKAMLAPFVFYGRLIGKWQDESRNLLIKLRVQKVLKEGYSTSVLEKARNLTNMTAVHFRQKFLFYSAAQMQLEAHSDVVVAFLRDDRSPTQRRRRPSPCPITLEGKPTAWLVTNGRYLVYAAPLLGPWATRLPRANFSAVALPDPFSRRANRTIHKALCTKCAALKAASVRFGRHQVTLKPFQPLRLRCILRGNPLPYVYWTKDGVPLQTNMSSGRFLIRHKRRRSRLNLSSVRTTDSGEYRCTASNVISRHPASASVHVTVRDIVFENRRSPWDRPRSEYHEQATNDSTHTTLPCPLSSYCLNGATCILLEMISEPYCVCPDGFHGLRCENKLVLVHLGRPSLDNANNPQSIGSPAEEYQVRSLKDHPLWRRLEQHSRSAGLQRRQ
ncbi:uncharacterized protein LOC111269319 isoform X3 [Varroa jacobsoni]|uniref:Protein vein n=1 Tax=Varroa destructor TaxID=109461 RepID=A0A7M7KEA5_VARDE|nr:uncharacterized protein LOC111252241 isoform X3 [Varroa destructor]XP_022704542.1 uncharacterized protein LOC111269319 isoform X3 [Varroa jacobsoni]